jgi:PAS domain S-box-containing protein
MSLIKKVFITVSLIATIALVVLLYFGLTFMRYGVSEATTTQQLQVARETMRAIDEALYGNYQQIGVLGKDDALVASLARPADTKLQATASEKMKEMADGTGGWEKLQIIHTNGTTVASTDSIDVGKTFPRDYAANAAMLDGAQKGKIVYSDVFADPATKQPTLLFAAPVYDDEKVNPVITGTIVGRISWDTVLQVLQNDRDDIVELYNAKGIELGDSEAANADEILSDHASDNQVVRKALSHIQGSQTAPSADGDYEALISYVPEEGYKDFRGNGWVLTIETPTAEAFALADSLGRMLPFIFAGVMGVAITLVMLVLNRIVVRHVKALTVTTQNIAAGDLTQRAHIKAKDEFGQLGIAFNRMADKLQELYRGLEAKVAEKTAQLGQRVQESETARARDEAILAGMGEGLIALDADGKVSLVNVRAAELFGVPRDKLFGRSLEETLAELHNAIDEPLAHDERPEIIAHNDRESISDDYVYRMPDGTKLSINVNATPIFTNNEVVGVVVIARDVTKAKEVDRMKTEFISLASHQLRTPLSAIRWFDEMLLSGDAGPLTDEQREFAQNINESTERMIQLVGSLLNISRIESGRIIVDPKPTDLKDLVGGIINDLHAKIEEKQQTLTISVHDELPKINLDPRLIGQVYLNLLTNAIKYTPKGGEISVFVSRNGEEIVSQVTDTGMGIPKAQQSRLFQKFFRADNAVKVETDGTGLGLYLVKAIIESSGGRIWYESVENKGTTFWFSLPMSGMRARAGEVTLDS